MIIVSGGRGERMCSETPKQYLSLGKYPILIHTIFNISRALREGDELVVVVPKGDIPFVQSLIKRYESDSSAPFFWQILLREGGESRSESVRNGLSALSVDVDYIGVHDGVRPFVSDRLMRDLLVALEEHPSVIPALSAIDSIRIKDEEGYKATDRDTIFFVQTPQLFHQLPFRQAYDLLRESSVGNVTDDATVVSGQLDILPFIVEGERQNIKITTPFDLVWAKMWLSQNDGLAV